MSDEINKNPLPRVIKGTGFYTPMDMAPGEAGPEPTVIREMGFPTSMHIEPPTQPETPPPQNSEGGDDSQNS